MGAARQTIKARILQLNVGVKMLLKNGPWIQLVDLTKISLSNLCHHQ